MENSPDTNPTILERAFELTALDRRHPDVRPAIRLLIDTVMIVGLEPEAVESVELEFRNKERVVAALGKALSGLADGPRDELAGKQKVDTAATIIVAAHEAIMGVEVPSEERLELQNAFIAFAGLRQTPGED